VVESCALADLPAHALGPLATDALTRLGWLGPPTEVGAVDRAAIDERFRD
jgi:hypothetical protein